VDEGHYTMTGKGFELYLVRHATAADRGAAWPDDGLRPLTPQGIRRFKEAVAGLAALGLKPDVILTSPLTRARQTATLLAAGAGEPPVTIVKALGPGTRPADCISAVMRAGKGGSVAIVGHEPDLGRLAAFLIGAARPLVFKKGGTCRIDVTVGTARPRGTLIWMATPRLLRLAGRS
jgi:phosphohistidine phosphatase